MSIVNKIEFTHILTATAFIEVYILYLFRFTKSVLTVDPINEWYTKFKWSAVALDMLSFMILLYSSKFMFPHSNKLLSGFIHNEMLVFLITALTIQITHDVLFWLTTLRTHMNKGTRTDNAILNELIDYSQNVQYGAILGDSFMVIVATPFLFYLLQSNMSNENMQFITIVCMYLIGYFVWQKQYCVRSSATWKRWMEGELRGDNDNTCTARRGVKRSI